MRKLLCIATVIAALKSLMHSIIVTLTQPSTERSARPWGRPESPAVAGGAVGARVELHVLDEILHASARAIDLFVEDFRAGFAVPWRGRPLPRLAR